jgi:hypothetical protein
MDRREYLKKSIRLSLLSVVLGLGGFLSLKSLESDTCTENSFCKNCKKYDDCDLIEKEVINEQ